MVIERNLFSMLRESKKSCLLLGPRQAGKSTLMRQLEPELTINFAHEPTYLEFMRNPHELEQRLAAHAYATVYIDEVQRIPSVLNTIQVILDEGPSAPRFLLTGSSARKLRRGQANLLPGRIHSYAMGPLCASELDYSLKTTQALSTGCLPGIYTDTSVRDREKTLRTYCATYLREEVQAEALTRNLEGFSRFLFIVAQYAGSTLDLTKFASEAGISRQSATRYFEILEDTLIVQRCGAFSKSGRKRLVQHPNFYFFDTGVLNGTLDNFAVSADRKGMLFEHLFANQLFASAAARDVSIRISRYRTEHGAEVDFIVELGNTVWAIEVKATRSTQRVAHRGFQSFAEFYDKAHRKCFVYLGKEKKRIHDIEIFPWQDLLREMGL